MGECHSPTPALELVVPAAMIQDATESESSLSQREGDMDVSDRPTHRRDSREVLSKPVAALRPSVHRGIPAELDPVALPGVGALLRHMDLPENTLRDIPSSGMRGIDMVCFTCSRSGHGVSRCSRVDIGSCGPRFSRETPTGPGGRVSLPDQ